MILTIITTRLMLTERKLNITNLYPVPPMQVHHVLRYILGFSVQLFVPGENAWKPFLGGSHRYSQPSLFLNVRDSDGESFEHP